MQVTDIKTRVKRMFGDESGVQLTDADIIQLINDGQRQMVMQNESLLEKTAVANSVASQSEYSLASLFPDLLIFRGLKYKGALDQSYFRLKSYNFNQFNELVDGWEGDTSTIGTPTMYSIFEQKIFLFPVPDTSIAQAIKVFYNRKPVDVANDGDTPDIPELYHDSLVNYCLMRAYEMDEDISTAAVKSQQIDNDLKLLRGREDWKVEETYPVITIPWEDM